MRNRDNNPQMDDSYEYRGFVDRLMTLPYVDISTVERCRDGWGMVFKYNTTLVTQLNQLAEKIYSNDGQVSQPLGSLNVTTRHKTESKLTYLTYKVEHNFTYNDLILIFGRLSDAFDKTIISPTDIKPREPVVKSDHGVGHLTRTHTPNTPVCKSMVALDQCLYINKIVHVGKRNNLELRARRLKRVIEQGVTREHFLDLAKTKDSYRNLTTGRHDEEEAIIKWLSASAPSAELTADDICDALVVQLIYNGYTDMSNSSILRIRTIDYPWTWNLAMTEEQHRWVRMNRVAEFAPNLYLEVRRVLDSDYDGGEWL